MIANVTRIDRMRRITLGLNACLSTNVTENYQLLASNVELGIGKITCQELSRYCACVVVSVSCVCVCVVCVCVCVCSVCV